MLPVLPSRGDPCISHGCSACCHDTQMLLTEADVARLRAARPGEDFFFQADDGHLQLRTRDGPAAPGMQGRPCWFLSARGRCTVHDVRPEGCRLYPAMWDDAAGTALLDDEHCPHTKEFRLPRASQDAVRRLAARLAAEQATRQGRATSWHGRAEP